MIRDNFRDVRKVFFSNLEVVQGMTTKKNFRNVFHLLQKTNIEELNKLPVKLEIVGRTMDANVSHSRLFPQILRISLNESNTVECMLDREGVIHYQVTLSEILLERDLKKCGEDIINGVIKLIEKEAA